MTAEEMGFLVNAMRTMLKEELAAYLGNGAMVDNLVDANVEPEINLDDGPEPEGGTNG